MRQDREIAAVPLSSFRVMPENNSRVDVRVLRNDEGLDRSQPREEVARIQVVGSVLIPASYVLLAGQRRMTPYATASKSQARARHSLMR